MGKETLGKCMYDEQVDEHADLDDYDDGYLY
jgi:hypothetical protein